ncbi:hypothetical protein PSQ40_06150 [Curvibacter sp. HBC61]|uniref:Uncharacterized protein n=1 Tax=Curvibacter cyanobacteriorum TaxID=3026422 RepID=A0ABT5MZF6_9BURK|nr:hypothetical protein [Curvibacter sp. HBC61]MDD0838148.1 hypothetical protein [Curvibacter sp. HBC61]
MHLKTAVFGVGVVALIGLVVACRLALRERKTGAQGDTQGADNGERLPIRRPGRRSILIAIPGCILSMALMQVLFSHSGRALFSSLVPLAIALSLIGLFVLGRWRLRAWMAQPACLIVGALGFVVWPSVSAAAWAWPVNGVILFIYGACSALLFLGCLRYMEAFPRP